MKQLFLYCTLLLILLGTACQKDNNHPPTVDFSCNDNPAVCDVTAANNEFAISLFKNLHADEPGHKNIFCSPFSISTALTMTANGASNQTFDALWQTLGYGAIDLATVNKSYQTLLQTLPHLDAGANLKIANSLWPQIGFDIKPAFVQDINTYFNSEVIPVDYKLGSTPGKVNNWVKDHTEGLIPTVVDELDPSTVLLLINTIYFKGGWRHKFDPDDTEPADFYATSGTEQVNMMSQEEQTYLFANDALKQSIDLPYQDSVYSMSIFMPQPGHTVEELMTELSPATYAQWLADMHPLTMNLFMPKFKIKYGKELSRILSDMGMAPAFSGAADFSRMTDQGVAINEVIHKAVGEVNEEGTEAAAVTVVQVVLTSVPFTQVVRIDRPFLFVIRDNKTNTILFMGKMMNPNAG